MVEYEIRAFERVEVYSDKLMKFIKRWKLVYIFTCNSKKELIVEVTKSMRFDKEHKDEYNWKYLVKEVRANEQKRNRSYHSKTNKLRVKKTSR